MSPSAYTQVAPVSRSMADLLSDWVSFMTLEIAVFVRKLDAAHKVFTGWGRVISEILIGEVKNFEHYFPRASFHQLRV